MLSKTDIHLRLENHAFFEFFKCFKKAIVIGEGLIESSDIREIGHIKIGEFIGDRRLYDKLIGMAESLSKAREPIEGITLADVITMKYFCGLYFAQLAALKFKKHTDENGI